MFSMLSACFYGNPSKFPKVKLLLVKLSFATDKLNEMFTTSAKSCQRCWRCNKHWPKYTDSQSQERAWLKCVFVRACVTQKPKSRKLFKAAFWMAHA